MRAKGVPWTASGLRATLLLCYHAHMPYLERATARLYFEDVGRGEAILTTHGLSENGTYWSLPGITDGLARRYRVVSLDMRGHGRSVTTGEPAGYDADTMADDLGALADHLGIDRFHLLSHATGGMVALRYARAHHRRLRSLLLTDTGSATALAADEAASRAIRDAIAGFFQGKSWDVLAAAQRANPEPFMSRLHAAARPQQAWAMVDAIQRLGSPATLAAFCRGFYTDPDPHVEQLRALGCPTLVLLGELDSVFVAPSELLAREIPNAKHVVMKGLGHMTALEAPEALLSELTSFLESLSTR
jgi:pimeloyl-ACP methyl ester carboxylesterase